MRTSAPSILLILVFATIGHAQNLDRVDSSVSRLFRDSCIACHEGEDSEGGLALDRLTADFADRANAAAWVEVMDNLNLGEMPPEGEDRPDAKLVASSIRWISDRLRDAQREGKSTGGRVLMRRLNRREYSNVVRDLLAVDFLDGEGPLNLLPPDGTLDGFDKVSKALLTDPSLMERYFEIARIVAEKAIVVGPPPVPTRRNRMEYEDISGGIEYIKHDRSVTVTPTGLISRSKSMRSDQRLRHPWNDSLVPVRGKYRLRLRVGAAPKDRDSLYIRVMRTGDGILYFGKVTGTIEEPETIEIVRDFDTPGSNEISVHYEDAPSFGRVNYHFSDLRKKADELSRSGEAELAGRIRSQMAAQGFSNQGRPEPSLRTIDHLPELFFDWIEMEGPLYKSWPPASTKRIFFKGLPSQQPPLAYAQEIFQRLLPRAFRRRVTQRETDAIVGIVASEMEHGESFTDAMKAGIVAMLCSPHFILIVEPTSDSDEPRELEPMELAARLSFFLWSSIPDDQLYRAAINGDLTNPDSLLKQITRMLADDRSEALADGFARQWLKADEFDRFAIDGNLYRDYFSTENAGLSEAINAEPIEFFRHLMKTGGDIRDFLDSDWTMANEVLARYYGIDGVEGSEFQRVALPKALHRGGLTTMAAVHRWGSDGNRTKPVERGKYILDVLFNDPPNPPPPNVGEVEPNVKGDDLTVRERLDQHRSIAACANCHRTIDPYGLALENFSVVSRWRTKQDGERSRWPDSAVIDSTGTLPNSKSFQSIEEFRRLLREQDTRFLRGIAEKMFTYALGRTVEASDRATIDQLVSDMNAGGNSFSSLILSIASSKPFRFK